MLCSDRNKKGRKKGQNTPKNVKQLTENIMEGRHWVILAITHQNRAQNLLEKQYRGIHWVDFGPEQNHTLRFTAKNHTGRVLGGFRPKHTLIITNYV
jgi:hypothetical protein